MELSNPGSLNEFAEQHTDLTEAEQISAYTKQLEAYRESVAPYVGAPIITSEILEEQKLAV